MSSYGRWESIWSHNWLHGLIFKHNHMAITGGFFMLCIYEDNEEVFEVRMIAWTMKNPTQANGATILIFSAHFLFIWLFQWSALVDPNLHWFHSFSRSSSDHMSRHRWAEGSSGSMVQGVTDWNLLRSSNYIRLCSKVLRIPRHPAFPLLVTPHTVCPATHCLIMLPLLATHCPL